MCSIRYSLFLFERIRFCFRNNYPTRKKQNKKDPGQLPPISSEGDDDSPTFTSFKNVWHLTERVRQTEGNPIVDLSDIIYEQIFRQVEPERGNDDRIKIVLKAIAESKLIGDAGFIHIKYKDFLPHYKKSSIDYLDSKVIAYRRKKVEDFNNVIRNHLYNNPHAQYIEGEIIYMNQTYYSEKDDSNNRAKWICYNSDEYKISGTTPGEEIEGVDSDLLYVDKMGHKHLASIENPFIPVVSKKGMKEYKNKIYWRKKNAVEALPKDKGAKWKYYYDLTGMFGDVSYGYCYTAHKSQGSTFKTVYVDINDILTIGPITTKRKLQAIYTAVTRASHLVVFLKSN